MPPLYGSILKAIEEFLIVHPVLSPILILICGLILISLASYIDSLKPRQYGSQDEHVKESLAKARQVLLNPSFKPSDLRFGDTQKVIDYLWESCNLSSTQPRYFPDALELAWDLYHRHEGLSKAAEAHCLLLLGRILDAKGDLDSAYGSLLRSKSLFEEARDVNQATAQKYLLQLTARIDYVPADSYAEPRLRA